MNYVPETRPSLLIRVRDASDRQAWSEFTEIYWPVIYRLARGRGMQHADAEDLAQQVLVSVSRAISRWENDPQRGRFRTWLQRVTNNAIINALTRRLPDRAAGGIDVLIDQPAAEGPDSRRLRIEYRREVFRWAARRIRQEFHTGTWDAFWLSTVEGREVEQVAKILGKSAGAVYAARSRVMRRLRQSVKEFEEA